MKKFIFALLMLGSQSCVTNSDVKSASSDAKVEDGLHKQRQKYVLEALEEIEHK